jgi:hypothetical protein
MPAEQPVVPRGVPATGAGAIVDLIASDPQPVIRTSYSDLLDEALAAPRVSETKVEVWVETLGPLGPGGHWEKI